MNITALLSWYDERPAWLAGLVASLRGQVDHLIAVDGAYALYPRARGTSPAEQAEAIRETARASRIGLTLHEPAMPWAGNEVEKRDFLFRLGEQVSAPEDWYFVIDGDSLLTSRSDIHALCEHARHDCAAVTMWSYREHFEPHERPFATAQVEETMLRAMFRAIPGLAVRENHYTYVTPDGRCLWGDGAKRRLEPCDTFSGVRLQHRKRSRDLMRNKAAADYYATRDRLNIEGLMPS